MVPRSQTHKRTFLLPCAVVFSVAVLRAGSVAAEATSSTADSPAAAAQDYEDTYYMSDYGDDKVCDNAYDYDITYEGGLYSGACSWLSGCNGTLAADCEGKCVVASANFNDVSAFVDGQLDINTDTIQRDTEMAWAVSCQLIATSVYRLTTRNLGLDGGLNDSTVGLGCPSDEQIDAVAALLAQDSEPAETPYTTLADEAVQPIVYSELKEDNLEPFARFKGSAQEAKDYITQKCTSELVPLELANRVYPYVPMYQYILEEQVPGGEFDSSLQQILAEGVLMCRDSIGYLETVTAQGRLGLGLTPEDRDLERAKIVAATDDVPSATCMEFWHKLPMMQPTPELEGSLHGSCAAEQASQMRAMHAECGKISEKATCVKKRIPEMQRKITAYSNAIRSQVSTSGLTDACMNAATNPWTNATLAPHSRDNAAIEKPEYRLVQTSTVATAPLPGPEAAPEAEESEVEDSEAEEADVVPTEPNGAVHLAGATVAAVILSLTLQV